MEGELISKETSKPKLRIGKLPDLTPVKMTIQVDPELHQMLEDYARIYTKNYNGSVGPAALMPSMLSGFLASDSGFKKARKELKKTNIRM